MAVEAQFKPHSWVSGSSAPPTPGGGSSYPPFVHGLPPTSVPPVPESEIEVPAGDWPLEVPAGDWPLEVFTEGTNISTGVSDDSIFKAELERILGHTRAELWRAHTLELRSYELGSERLEARTKSVEAAGEEAVLRSSSGAVAQWVGIVANGEVDLQKGVLRSSSGTPVQMTGIVTNGDSDPQKGVLRSSSGTPVQMTGIVTKSDSDPQKDVKLPKVSFKSSSSDKPEVAKVSTPTLRTDATRSWSTGDIHLPDTDASSAFQVSAQHNRVKRIMYASFQTRIDWWLNLTEPDRHGMLADFVLGMFFQSLIALVIAVNVGWSIMLADMDVDRQLQILSGKASFRLPEWVTVVDAIFLVFYILEIILKLSVHGLHFFCNHDMAWNGFDFMLVIFAAYDFVSGFQAGTPGGTSSLLRTARFLKLAKVLRVVRVMRFFSELRLILHSLAGSLSSLFWSISMLFLIFYVFGLVFVQGCADYIKDLAAGPDLQAFDHQSHVDKQKEVDNMLFYFGNVRVSMLSLYMSSFGGEDWARIYASAQAMGNIPSCFFVFFIAFIQIALLNILTGIFVENAMKLAQPDRDAQALQFRMQEIAEAKELHRLVKEIDTDGTGFIDPEALSVHLRSGRLRAYLSVIGLDIRDAEAFFQMLLKASDGTGVDAESFVRGCMRLKGTASSIDLQAMAFETRVMHNEQNIIYEDLLEKLDDILKAAQRYPRSPSVSLHEDASSSHTQDTKAFLRRKRSVYASNQVSRSLDKLDDEVSCGEATNGG